MRAPKLGRAAVLGVLAVFALVPTAQAASTKTCKIVAKHDPDHDGTLDLNEVKAAARAAFARHNPDNDGTLDIKEAKGLLSKKDFKKANRDKDGTLDDAEFMVVVAKRFKHANPDNDGTLDCKELKSKRGKRLQKLMK